MAVRVNDFVFIFNGGDPFTKLSTVADDFDIGPYNAAKAKLNHTRTVTTESRGADDNINANVKAVMGSILAKSQLNTIGQVVLLGRSNGCALALGLAAELNAQGI